jgi:hypothetical protein
LAIRQSVEVKNRTGWKPVLNQIPILKCLGGDYFFFLAAAFLAAGFFAAFFFVAMQFTSNQF